MNISDRIRSAPTKVIILNLNLSFGVFFFGGWLACLSALDAAGKLPFHTLSLFGLSPSEMAALFTASAAALLAWLNLFVFIRFADQGQ